MSGNSILQSKKSQLLMLLHQGGPISQADVARKLNVSAAAVNVHVKSLKKTGLLQEEEVTGTSVTVGRPGQLLSISKTTNLSLSIVFDASLCSIGLADFAGKVLLRRDIELSEISDSVLLLMRISDYVEECLRYAGENDLLVRFACIACPGMLAPDTGVVLKSVNIPMLEGIDFETELKKRFGLDSHVISEGIAHFWGEFDREVNGAECMMINWGIGVGCIVGHGHRITYPSPEVKGMRGDLGHVVVEPGGRVCKCGQRGCLEAYVGGGALVERLRETGSREYENLTYRGLIEAAKSGDSAVLELLEQAAGMIGEMFSWPMMLMGVKQVSLTGDLGILKELVIDSFKAGMLKRMHDEAVESMNIASSRASQDTLLAGANALAAIFYFDDSILSSLRLES